MKYAMYLPALFAILCCGATSSAEAQETENSLTGVHILHSWLGEQCTFAPDLDIGFCCGAHDDAYAIGGTERDRIRADRTFFRCIYNEGRPLVARIYYFGVRWFGWAFFNYGGA